MTKDVLKVEGMSCNHCVNAITKAVGGLPGMGEVIVDLAAKTVAIEHDPVQCPLDKIKTEIEDQGYEIIA